MKVGDIVRIISGNMLHPDFVGVVGMVLDPNMGYYVDLANARPRYLQIRILLPENWKGINVTDTYRFAVTDLEVLPENEAVFYKLKLGGQ